MMVVLQPTVVMSMLSRFSLISQSSSLLFWNSCSISLRCCICGNIAFWIASILNIYVDHLAYQAYQKRSKRRRQRNTEAPNTASSSTRTDDRAEATAMTATAAAAAAAPKDRVVSSSSSSWDMIGEYLLQQKLQPMIHLSNVELRNAILLSSLNMLLVAPFICCPIFEIVWNYLHQEDRVQLYSSSKVCWNWKREVLFIWPMNMILNEISFYFIHYVLHHGTAIINIPLYQHIHKVHHTYTSPSAICAAYAHPIEFVLGNVACIALGPIALNAHPHTCYLWFTLAMLSTCKGHCGYNIFNASTHDLHHQYFHFNYGVLHFGDYLMDTTFSTTNKKEKGRINGNGISKKKTNPLTTTFWGEGPTKISNVRMETKSPSPTR